MLKIINYNADEYDFPALVVLGCFDAVHIGHQALLKKAKLNAKINGLDLGVMMFADGKGGRQVFTFEERVAMLEQYNAKFILRIDYTEEFKKTSAQDFLENLEQHINLKGYMSGKDFRFGAGAKGKSSTLKKYAEDEDNAVWYEAVKDVALDGEKVSTTLIKQCLEEGKINKASQLLGRQFFVSGEVCEGHGRGKQLGFPTANIAYPENKVLVAPGVYGVEAEIDGTVYKGVANCGPRPTFGEDSYTLEVYFEGLSEDLYGKTVTVRFLNYIRGIRKFATAEELAAQIAVDATCIGAPDAAVEEAPAVAAEAPVAEEVAEEPATEEAATEEPAAEEVAEQPAEEEIAVAAEEVAETLSEETPAETFAEVVEDETETPAQELAIAAEEELAAEEAAEEPATEEVAEEPAAEEVAEEPATEEVAEEPATEEVAEEPATEEVAEEPAAEEAAEEPATEESVEEPATEEVAEENVTEEADTEEPAVEEVAGQPAEEEIAVAAEEVAETLSEETPAETFAEVVEDETETPAQELAIAAEEELAAEEAAEEPAAEEVAEEPATEEVAEEPVTEEVAEEPVTEEATEEGSEAEGAGEDDSEEEAEDAAAEERSGKKRRRKGRGKSDRRRGRR